MANFCRSCGCRLLDGAAFCANCGTAADDGTNAQSRQSADRSGRASPEPGTPGTRKAAGAAAGAGKTPSLWAGLKKTVRSYLQNPLKLLPGIVLTVIWIALSLLGTLGGSSQVIRVLNTLSYSNGGMYGGILGCIGGIFGKAFFSAIIISLVSSLTEKKTASARAGKAAGAGMKRAAMSGWKAIAPLLIGSGAGLALYWFFNVTSTPKNIMVAVAGALAAITAVIRGRGLLFSLVSGLARLLSKGRSPSLSAVKRSLTGFSAGFAVGIPVTLLRKPWIILGAGIILLAVGIVLFVIRKSGAKRAAARAAVLFLAGSLLLPLVHSASASALASDLTGNYTGTIQMISGAVAEEGYSNYTNGTEAYVSFVNRYMGGTPSERLSRDAFDEKLSALIETSEIAATDAGMRVAAVDPASGKYSVSFSLAAKHCSWNTQEDAYSLGSEPIEVTLTGSYSDHKLEITEGSGDTPMAVGTIEFSDENGRLRAKSTNLVILVAKNGVSCYAGLIRIDAEQTEADPGQHSGASGIAMDDILGYYLYTGLNYATNETEDFYFKIERLSASSFRFTSLTPSSEELPEIDWKSVYEDGENVEYIETDNHADLSVYQFDPNTASALSEESVTARKVIEHYPDLNISIEVYNSESRSCCGLVFSRGEDGRIHADYDSRIDLGAGYSTIDRFHLIKVDHLPGEEAPEDTAEESAPEAGTDARPEETEPFAEDTDARSGEEDHEPDPQPDTEEDPDRADLPDSSADIIAESAATALIGGGLGALLGGIGASDGDDGPDGDENGLSGGDTELPPGWRIGSEGDISFEDPSTGKTVRYVPTGVNPDTGQPEYHNAENWGQGYDIDDLKDLYQRSSDERDYYKNIHDTYNKTQEEQRKENQDLSWEAKDWAREKKDIAERERMEDARNKAAYKRGIYDGDAKEFKKQVLKERNQIYQEQAKYEASAEYANAGYQSAQTIQKGADIAIDTAAKIAEKSGNPVLAAKAKAIKKGYIAAKNAASNLGEYMAGTKNLTQAVSDTAIGATGDLIKDSADGFGQKLLINTTMEGGKTVFQGWVDGKSAEEIRDQTLKKIEKATADTVNEATVGAVFGDTPTATFLTGLANMEKNED